VTKKFQKNILKYFGAKYLEVFWGKVYW